MGRKIAITGIKDAKPKVAWFQDPDYQDWSGEFENEPVTCPAPIPFFIS